MCQRSRKSSVAPELVAQKRGRGTETQLTAFSGAKEKSSPEGRMAQVEAAAFWLKGTTNATLSILPRKETWQGPQAPALSVRTSDGMDSPLSTHWFGGWWEHTSFL